MNLQDRVRAKLRQLQRQFLYDPIRTVPEFSRRIPGKAQRRYGPDSRNCQEIADMLLFAVQYVVGASVPGDIAEFGCMTGRTATVLAAAMASFRTDKALHLFDSFEGLPESTSAVDRSSFHVRDGVWAPGTCLGITPVALREKCARHLGSDKIRIYEGWFSQTVPRLPQGTQLSLLHVDCDLYQSTLDALGHVFGQGMVSQGAILLFDDWNCNRASRDHGERKAWQELIVRYSIDHSDSGSYGWAGHKFIVHSYQSSNGPA